MKKRLSIAVVVASLSLFASIPVFGAVDSSAETFGNILYYDSTQKTVHGVALARSTNSNFKSINVTASFYQGSTKKETGTDSTSVKGNTAQWFTKNTYPSSNSYTINVASRTYYTDGTSSDQSYYSAYWN